MLILQLAKGRNIVVKRLKVTDKFCLIGELASFWLSTPLV